MSEPQVVGCSWLSEREFIGRGRVEWHLAPQGTFVYLDGGTLDLGIVRDSTLNATNDFQVFGVAFDAKMAFAFNNTIVASGEITTTDTSIVYPAIVYQSFIDP